MGERNMHERYTDERIKTIWSDENKLRYWQHTELMAIKAKVDLEIIDADVFTDIKKALSSNPIDIEWWKNRDEEIRHDLNAFLDERKRHIPLNLRHRLHEDMTSYDTEEPAFVRMLNESVVIVYEEAVKLDNTLRKLAIKHRYTIMNGRTHGQEAKLQSYGKRCLSHLVDLRLDLENLQKAEKCLEFAKLSGATGNYGDMDPKVERTTLKFLGLKPFYGATQILPRELFAPLAQALCQIVLTLDKIATSIRLGARSGRPIFQEPFSKKQKGSSAMPHKRNTIKTEQIEGMGRMARGYMNMIIEGIKTWEERAIEQSCVERVAWPDLFHVVIHSLKVMDKVLSELNVYRDNMLLEIVDSCGTYASEEAKKFLREIMAKRKYDTDIAYRIVQLASFNAFEPIRDQQGLRDYKRLESFQESEYALSAMTKLTAKKRESIQTIISEAKLCHSPLLEAAEYEVVTWNKLLKSVFDGQTLSHWNEIFLPAHLLKHEDFLYQQILGE